MTNDFKKSLKAAKTASVPIVGITCNDPASVIRTIVELFGKSYPIISWDCVSGCKSLSNSKFNKIAKEVISTVGEGGESLLLDMFLDLIKNRVPSQIPIILIIHNGLNFLHDDNLSCQQAVWNLRDKFKVDRSMLILLGKTSKVPMLLKDDIIMLEEPLPSREELKQIAEALDKAASTCPVCSGDGSQCENCNGSG